MTDCQIFTTFVAAERVWKEIEYLVDEFSSSVKDHSKDGVAIHKTTWGSSDDLDDPPNQTNVWCDCDLRLRLKGKGPFRSRLLTLYFDLARDLVPKDKADWPQAREALLVVGFDPRQKGGSWAPYAAVHPEGRLKEAEAWDACRNHVFADGRLLEAEETSVSDEGWSQRAWLFAIPLRRLTNADAVLEQLTKPVVALLSDKEPEIALAGTEAVKWNVKR